MSNNILENPKQFFESLSKEEFKMLLDEFEFKYEEIKKEGNKNEAIKVREEAENKYFKNFNRGGLNE